MSKQSNKSSPVYSELVESLQKTKNVDKEIYTLNALEPVVRVMQGIWDYPW